MELSVGLSALLRRLPDIRLADPEGAEFVFTGNENLRMKRLRATFTPRPA
jgi:cytochrome P450